jgi:DNA polymerase III epsilon subunit family exonuclease
MMDTIGAIVVCGLLAFWIYFRSMNEASRQSEIIDLKRRIEKMQQERQDHLEFMSQDFVAIDVETTGLKAAKSNVLQLGMVFFKDMKVVDRKNYFFNPGVSIPENITKINRITNDMVKYSPFFADICEEISDLFEDTGVVGHNITFDLDMLGAEFKRVGGYYFEPDIIFCTMKLTDDPYGYYTEYDDFDDRREPWKKLSAAANHYNVKIEGDFHDALVDAEVAGKLFIEIHREELKDIDFKIDSLKYRLKQYEK